MTASSDPRAEGAAFGHGAVGPEDHDILPPASELRDRERTGGGLFLVTVGLEVVTADPNDPVRPDAQDADLTGLHCWS